MCFDAFSLFLLTKCSNGEWKITLNFHIYTDKFSQLFVRSSRLLIPQSHSPADCPVLMLSSKSPPSPFQVFDHHFSCANRGVLPAMILLILPGVLSQLSSYHGTDVLASVVLIVPCLPFKHHDFDVRSPTGIDTAAAQWIKASGRRHRKVSLILSPFTMTITKPIKHSGQVPRAPHKAANSPASTSASAARKSSRVPCPSFKVIDSLVSLESPPSTKLSSQPSLKAADSFSSLSSSPSWPPLKAADSISSLTSSSS